MKKLLTLFTLLVASVTGASAAEETWSYNVNDGNLTCTNFTISLGANTSQNSKKRIALTKGSASSFTITANGGATLDGISFTWKNSPSGNNLEDNATVTSGTWGGTKYNTWSKSGTTGPTSVTFTMNDGSSSVTIEGIAVTYTTSGGGGTTYTVTYDVNGGGSCATTSATQPTEGAELTLPTPTWAGYTFDGWYNDGSYIGGEGAKYAPTADITLYAKWTDNTEGKLFSYVDGNYGNKFKAFDGSDWVTANADNKSKTFTDVTTGAQYIITNGTWEKKNNSISALAKFVKGTSEMSIKIPIGYQATVKILYGAYGTSDDYKMTVKGTAQAKPNAAFDDGHTNAQIASDMKEITLNNQSGTLDLSVNGSKNIYIGRVAVVLTKVSGTITEAGWNTFSSKVALDLSTLSATNEVKAYYASAASDGKVTMSSTDAIVPAGEGLMIKGTVGEVFTIDAATGNGTNIVGNLLEGLPNGGTVAKGANNYVFAWQTGNVSTTAGFYYVNDAEPTLDAGKAYLHTTTPLSGKLNIIIDDSTSQEEETDGIKAVSTNVENGVRYNLAGQKVGADYKGIVIVNGKKVIIK